MPVAGKDWHSPGEIWVKTRNGWRTSRTIMIINSNNNTSSGQEGAQNSRSLDNEEQSIERKGDEGYHWKGKSPYVVLPGYAGHGPLFYLLSKGGSKQSDNYSTVGDAFQALDFRRSVRDQRKFVYVCRLLEVLLKQQFSQGCGTIQKQLFMTLDEAVHTVLETELNVHVTRHLIHLAKEQLVKEKSTSYFNYGNLWQNRLDKIIEWQGKLSRFKIRKLCRGTSKASTHIKDLPDECLRMIFRCFSDHRDICRLAQVNRHFHRLCDETLLWRDLSKYHFSKSQIESIDSNIRSDWKATFKRLISKSSLKEFYGDMLQLCSHCHYLFWKYSIHSCTYDASMVEHKPPVYIPITPKGFLHLFEN